MKKLIVLLWVVFMPMTAIIAQSNDDKQEIYDQLKDWAVVKLTIAYMEDLRGWDSNTKVNNTKEFITYKKLVNDYQEFSNKKDINLEDVGQVLENGDWTATKKNVFDLYEISVYNSVYDYNFSGIPSYGYNNTSSKENYNKTITKLENKFEELLIDKNIDEEQPDPNNNIVETELGNSNEESINENSGEANGESNSDLSFWFYGILLALIISVIINFILKFKNKNLQRSLNSTKSVRKNSTSGQDLFSPTAKRLIQEKQVLKSENDRLNNEIENFKREIEILKNNPTSGVEHTILKTIVPTPSQLIKLEVSQQNANNLIYLSSPFQNLTFANEDAGKDKTLNSLYVVEFNEQVQTGSLSVLEDSDLSKALNSPDTYLETACTYDNEYSNNVRAIKVTEKGEIKLEGDDWIVTKKVRIKFI